MIVVGSFLAVMASKKLKFASALVCAAFAPQAAGFCAVNIDKGVKEENLEEKNVKKYEKYLNNSVEHNTLNESTGDDQLEDDFEGDGLDFSAQVKSNLLRSKGLFYKFSSKISSYKRRYKKLIDLLKKVAVYGALGYSAINFAPLLIEKVNSGPTVDSKLFSDGINQNVLKLMQNPKVNFSFIVSDVSGKELNENEKKASVEDISKFLENFEKSYRNTGGNIDVGKFESGVTADFESDSSRERMIIYCANLRSLPIDSIAEHYGLGDSDKVKKLLDATINREYMKISDAAASSKRGEYHGFWNSESREDFIRAVYNMWQGAKKAGLKVGGRALTSVGTSLTMTLPGWQKILGVLCTTAGSILTYFEDEKRMQEQKGLMQ